MGRRRARPSDPSLTARRRALAREADRDPANWGLNREALALPSQSGLEARADAAGRVCRARRIDPFERLLAGAADSLAALRRLQSDLLLAQAKSGGVARYAERIDCGRPVEDPLVDARRRAFERTRQALTLAGPASARLLTALCEAPELATWRAVVERLSGERLADAQGAVVRAACANLAEAYARMDRRR